MSSAIYNEHPEARKLEDAAWKAKDMAARFYERAFTSADRSVVCAAQRDIERICATLENHLAGRKRKAKATEPSDVDEAEQQPLIT